MLQEAIAVIWDDTWFIGFYLGKNDDGSLRVDHLVRDTLKTFKQHEAWKREFTHSDDIQDVMPIQIIPVEVIGVWFFGKRKSLFVVEN